MKSAIHAVLYSTVLYCCTAVVYGTRCTEVEHRQMMTEYSDCHRQYYDSDLNDGDICVYLHQTIDVCGEKWNICHSPEEIIRLKRQHISAFLQRAQGDNSILNCPTVIKFRETEASEVEKETAKSCSSDDSTAATNSFQSCSRGISSNVYSSIADLESPQQIVQALCDGLRRISSQCPRHLEACFAQKDAQHMIKQHAEQTKEFFARLVEGRIPADSLDHCSSKKDVTEDQEINELPKSLDTIESITKKEEKKTVPSPVKDNMNKVEEFTERINKAEDTVASEVNNVPEITEKDQGWFVEDKVPDITGPYSNPIQPRNRKVPEAFSVKGLGVRTTAGLGTAAVIFSSIMMAFIL